MSLASFFDSLFIPAGQQTPAEAQANYANQQQQLAAQTNARIAAGTLDPNSAEAQQNFALADASPLQDPGAAAEQTFFTSLNPLAAQPNDGTATPGIGSVLTDVLVIGTIGAGIWAFFEFGGVGFLKSLAAKSKWWVVGILAGVALLLWFIWSQFQKTASDTSSTVSGIEAGIQALNPFSSPSTSTS